ncbi:MAG: uroporphyrinogen decarboxylase [Candidatus Caenarcaniphilales bacterium]|nr:uroporphyrinogen decarboxylase [Candidatus Caenarcaniphilales bacterium]
MFLSSKELFLRAFSGDKDLPRPPVWFMRQAGRYLPEYQAIRKKVKFLDLCRNPELAAEVSLQPVEIIDVDAAIIFSDILLPLADFGVDVQFPESGGIKVNLADGNTLKNFQVGPNIQATCKAIQILKAQLKQKNLEVPVLGFCGAPWTLANYILEGGSSKNRELIQAKQLAWSNPDELKSILSSLSKAMIVYLQEQISSGADAVQLFDTWAGELSEQDFCEFVLPYIKEIFSALPTEIPKILFIKGVNPYIEHVSDIGADVLSVDWKTSLTQAWDRLSTTPGNTIKCLQGNLDPHILTIEPQIAYQQTKKIIEEGKRIGCSHILNLGHGVTPNAKVESAKAFVKAAKESIK